MQDAYAMDVLCVPTVTHSEPRLRSVSLQSWERPRGCTQRRRSSLGWCCRWAPRAAGASASWGRTLQGCLRRATTSTGCGSAGAPLHAVRLYQSKEAVTDERWGMRHQLPECGWLHVSISTEGHTSMAETNVHTSVCDATRANTDPLVQSAHGAGALGMFCNRDIAQEGAIGFLRQLVPSDEWLTAGFWRQTAQKAKTAGKRVVGVILDDGEGDLDDWLEHKVPGSCSRQDSSMEFHSICRHELGFSMPVVQLVCRLGDVQLPMASRYTTSLLCWLQGTDSPLRAQAAKALQALRSGAEQAGLDPRTLRQQVRWVVNRRTRCLP